MVKSAQRVLQILEFFDARRASASEAEIARELKLPQSSTAALLRTMLNMGFIALDRTTRHYSLSERAALIGSWTDFGLVEAGPIIRLMEDIHRKTRLTVCLSRRLGTEIYNIYSIRPAAARYPRSASGRVGPVPRTVPGRALLYETSDPEVSRLVLRSNAEATCSAAPISLADFRQTLEADRRRGFSFGDSQIYDGLSIISTVLPLNGEHGGRLAIAIAGRPEEMVVRRFEFASVLLRSIECSLTANEMVPRSF